MYISCHLTRTGPSMSELHDLSVSQSAVDDRIVREAGATPLLGGRPTHVHIQISVGSERRGKHEVMLASVGRVFSECVRRGQKADGTLVLPGKVLEQNMHCLPMESEAQIHFNGHAAPARRRFGYCRPETIFLYFLNQPDPTFPVQPDLRANMSSN